MIIKSNKGITLLALVITVILLVLIASTAITITINMTGTAQFENVETDLLLIRSKCKTKADLYAIGEIEEDELYGEKQSSEVTLGEDDVTETLSAGWYLLSQADLNEMGLEKLAAEKKYYVYYDFNNGGDDDDVAYGYRNNISR